MSTSWQGGSTRRWRRIRTAVLLRDAGKGCRAHNEGWCARASTKPHTCADRGEVAHHTHGRAVTGDDMRFIVSACSVCNLAIGEPGKAPDPPGRGMTRW